MEGEPMLVLTGKERDSVTIGHGIVVTVLAVKGKQVRLGFTAPAEIPIVRADAKNKQRKGATHAT
jgi:carbon storage regulator